MTTKRLPFQASTLCAGGTLLVLGGFLTLNLAGCGGGGGGGIGTPTAVPGTTATPAPASLQFQLQLTGGANATGGTVRLTSASGLNYSATANSRGVASIGRVTPGLYTLVFTVIGANGQSVSTTRSITITSSTTAQTFNLRQGDTGTSNPFTITGRILLNPGGTNDPDGNSATANCGDVVTPITDAVVITVLDLNSTNGTPIIAQIVRPAQPASTTGTQRGVYSITVPYQPRSLRVTVANSNDAPFAGVSASTSFPQTDTTTGQPLLVLRNVDVCTNNSTIAPQPAVTATPSPSPFATATTVGTSSATPTPSPVPNPTAVPTLAPTSTPQPTATIQPTNTPVPGTTTPTTAP